MLRVAAFLLVLFAALLVLRALRVFLERLLARARPRRASAVEGEMVRDPVCGVWIDRRLAIPAGPDGLRTAVCSEACRRALESGPPGRARVAP